MRPVVIPRVVYQTWKTKDRRAMSRPIRRWVRTWERLEPAFEHRIFDDEDCLAFVRTHFAEHEAAYVSLRPVERADFWRYMVIFERGGLYTDLDTVCRAPVERWLRADDAVVLGLETDLIDEYPGWKPTRFVQSGGGYAPEAGWRDNVVLFCNWTFAARPKHPLFADVIRRVAINAVDPYFVHDNPDWTIKKTGPGVLTDAINAHLECHGTTAAGVAMRLRREPEVTVGGVRILDYDAFHTKYVKHVGLGTWKPPAGGLGWLWKKARVAFG